MNSFTRTTSGIANYPRFFNTEFIIYTEGKSVSLKNKSQLIPDAIFYKNLASSILGTNNIKIKCVGNKATALSYLNQLNNVDNSKSIVIIDRDYDGTFNSIIDNKNLIYTYGYSWENDFWSEELALEIVRTICHDTQQATLSFIQLQKRVQKRLKLVSLFDAVCQLNGKSILKKSTALCGLRFNWTQLHPLNYSDFSRVISPFKTANYKNCTLSKSFLEKISQLETCKLIQGHLWSNIIINLIAFIYQNMTQDSKPSKAMLENIGMGIFKQNPLQLLSQSAATYYSQQLTSKLLH